MTFDYALHELSYVNMIMYSAIIPSPKRNGKDKQQEVIKADDPRNRDKVRKAFEQFQ